MVGPDGVRTSSECSRPASAALLGDYLSFRSTTLSPRGARTTPERGTNEPRPPAWTIGPWRCGATTRQRFAKCIFGTGALAPLVFVARAVVSHVASSPHRTSPTPL